MRPRLNDKFSIIICLIVVATIGSFMLIGNLAITSAIEWDIGRDLLKTREFFKYFQESRFRNLQTAGRIIVEVPYLKSVVATPDIDHATVLDSALEIQQIIGSDLLILSDAEGRLLASTARPREYGGSLLDQPVFQAALKGEAFLGIWTADQDVYRVAVSPVMFGEEIAGALLIGSKIDRALMEQLAVMTNCEIALRVSGQFIPSPGFKEGWIKDVTQAVEKISGGPRADGGRIIHLSLDGERYLLLTAPLTHDVNGGFYVMARSLEKELAVYKNLQRRLLFLGIIILLLALVTGTFYSRKITKPISDLVEGTRRIAGGDMSFRVNISSGDEIGQLADSFNVMTKRLKESHENLEEKIKMRTRELEETQTQLLQSEKLASIGQLAAGVAHEINNPLGFVGNNVEILKQYIDSYADILGMLERLKETARQGDAEKAKMLVEEIARREKDLNLDYINDDIPNLLKHTQNGIERIRKIVMDLRTFSRADTGMMDSVRVEEIIDSILSIVHNELKYKAELKKSYGQTPPVACNAQQLGQVFINLLMNASQAIDGRGVIEIKTRSQGAYVCVEVSDTGKGIKEEHLKKIFDPFFTTKPIGQGTGLGLSVSYEIVKKHGGDIKVSSKVGEGTVFTVMLPVPS